MSRIVAAVTLLMPQIGLNISVNYKTARATIIQLFKQIYLSDPMTLSTLALQVSPSTPDIPLSPPSQPDIQPGTSVPEPEIPQPSTQPEVPQQPNDPIIIEPTVPEISPIQS